MGAMVTRTESAALTRRALLDAAAELLDSGGPEAVTLREVGARAGVTRGAPYRHFADKNSLLATIAVEGWERIGDRVHALRTDPALSASEQLSGALRALVGVGRDHPHLYQILFWPSEHRFRQHRNGPDRVRDQLCGAAGGPAAAVQAAERFQNEFLAIVAALIGKQDAPHYGALLLAGAHGIAGMELTGHLGPAKWSTTADELVDTLVRRVADAAPDETARRVI